MIRPKKKTTTKKKSVSKLNGTKRTALSRKKLLDELISIEKEGQIYEKILRDARLKKQPEIVKAAQDGLKLLGKRQREIFKAIGL
jgi:hypothetical protein